jgi:hypothetical protein
LTTQKTIDSPPNENEKKKISYRLTSAGRFGFFNGAQASQLMLNSAAKAQIVDFFSSSCVDIVKQVQLPYVYNS